MALLLQRAPWHPFIKEVEEETEEQQQGQEKKVRRQEGEKPAARGEYREL